ncbi:hypothetical protein [Enterobacter soli]|uniref:hypothetical protein n=1 Tax=Enterobacter soli TaxID=885040 RepID=UPI0034CEA474
MKSNRTKDRQSQTHPTGLRPQPAAGAEALRQPQQKDKAFIEAMNAFTAKAGLLSEDPYFGGI